MINLSRCGALLLAAFPLAAQPQFNISTIAGGAPPVTPVAALNASFGQPQRVAADAGGNIYFSSDNCIFKVDTGGILTRVAGNARAGYSGDEGPAIAAQLNQPQGIAVDKSGKIYIADAGNHVVRMVTTDGVIHNFAGNGTAGSSGDGGAANDPSNAQLSRPVALAIDGAGNVYIADAASYNVREVTAANGNIATFAGTGTTGFAGDGGSATGAQISAPLDIAIDSSSNLYIADSDNNSIRKVDSSGNITTIAGNQTPGYTGDGDAATKAQLNHPVGVTVDSQGNLYIAEYTNNLIRRVDSKGNITTYAGNGGFGLAGDGGAAKSASFGNLLGIAVDSSGNLYVVDLWNFRIRKISNGNISTVAGGGVFLYSGDGGPATGAQFNLPGGIAVDGARNVYISDSGNHRVRKVAPNGVVSTVAGNGQAGFGGDNGQAAAAQLNHPWGLALDSAGNLYIADTLNSRIRKVATDGTITTVAGNGNPGYSGDNGAATNAQLNVPAGVAVDKAGNIYVADTGNHRVRVVSGGTITTLAGTGIPGFGGTGDADPSQPGVGPANAEPLFYPTAVAVDSAAKVNVYIADTQNHQARVVTSDGVIRPIAGNGYPGYFGDGGDALAAAVVAPSSLVIDAASNIYIASQGGQAIRVVDRQGVIRTIAGGTVQGYSGDGGAATSARLNGAQAIALDGAGNVYVADTNNNAVRLLTPAQ